jgi:transitional endoplasmic reticulum ATPase
MPDSEIELKVAEAMQNDVGRGIVRIDSLSARKLGVTTGDIVEVVGSKSTAAKIWQSHQEDEGRGIIRMDGTIRQNSGASLGDKVKVKKADVKAAKRIIIAPTEQPIKFGEDFASYIKQRVLMGRPLKTADIFFITVLNQPISFTITNTKPDGIIVVTEQSSIEVKGKPMAPATYSGHAVRYEDIGGLKDEVSRVREMIELPMKHPELFEKLGIKPPKGVLLFGPPGTGKTLLAKAVASESNAHFVHVNGPEIMDKFYGESERKLRDLFEDAQQNAPSIIFIDELDSIAPKRDDTKGEVERRVVAQLLALMDGLVTRGNVIVVAATNRPDAIDPALRRPGRFDREIEIGVPDKEGRKEILQIHTRGMPLFHLDSAVAAAILDNRINLYEQRERKAIDDLQNKAIQINKNDKDANKFLEELKQSITRKLQNVKVVQKIKEKIDKKKESLLPITQLDVLEEVCSKINLHKRITSESDDLGPEKNQGILDARPLFIDGKLHDLGLDSKELLRELIETGIFSKDEIIAKSVQKLIEEKAKITHGFVGADLSAIGREAAMHALKRILPKIDLDSETIPAEVLETLRVTKEDFNEAMKLVEPSALREVMVEVPNVLWTDVGGLKKVKDELKEAVEWPLKKPEMFKRLGINPSKAVLLYGPPGCGKTMLAKAVATESEANFIAIKGPELLSKWVGESEKGIREIFKKARQTAPTIIFFDEIDSITPRRGLEYGSHVIESVVNQILTELDGIERLESVMIIGATNRPDIIDPSFLRPGRFDRLVLVPLPDKDAREEVLKVHTKGMPLQGVNLEELSRKTEGYSGADIEALCREAAMSALREDQESKIIEPKHFERAFQEVKPSVTTDEAKSYEKGFKRGKKDEKIPAYM